MNRDVGSDLLSERDLKKIYMQDHVRYRVLLNIPHKSRARVVPIQAQVHDLVATGRFQNLFQFFSRDLDGLRLYVVSIDIGRSEPSESQYLHFFPYHLARGDL